MITFGLRHLLGLSLPSVSGPVTPSPAVEVRREHTVSRIEPCEPRVPRRPAPNPGLHADLPPLPRTPPKRPDDRVRAALDHLAAVRPSVPAGGSEAALIDDLTWILGGGE